MPQLQSDNYATTVSAMRTVLIAVAGRSIPVVLICIFGGAPTEIPGQETSVFEPGVRVRVTAPACGLSGRATEFRALRADTLVLDATECPLASVTHLDVSRGRKSLAILSASLGFAAGAAGAVVYCKSVKKNEFSEEGACVVFDSDTTPYQALLVGGLGGLVGGIVGYFIKTDRWEEVPLERVRATLAPQSYGRFALGFSVRF